MATRILTRQENAMLNNFRRIKSITVRRCIAALIRGIAKELQS